MNFFETDQTFVCQDLAATRALAQLAARSIQKNQRLLLLLDGEMGAGKTQFIRFLLEAMNSPSATSPSFAIHNSYDSQLGAVEHVDLYRLADGDDLESTGFWDLFLNASGLVLIEWGCRLREMGLIDGLPRTWPKYQLEFRILAETSREVSLRRLS